MSLTASIMTQLQRGILLPVLAAFLIAGVPFLQAATSTTHAQTPWDKPRSLSDFQSLLDHSPFCLPTAEESSPLADRYALTGIVTINGAEEIFVVDRTDQSREMLTHTPNLKNMSLVSLVREGNATLQKATIRVGTDTGTISYLEAAPQQAQSVTLQGPPGPNAIRPTILPRLPSLPQVPGVQNPQRFIGPRPGVMTPPTRRIIRRPMVAPPQPAASVPSPTQ